MLLDMLNCQKLYLPGKSFRMELTNDCDVVSQFFTLKPQKAGFLCW